MSSLLLVGLLTIPADTAIIGILSDPVSVHPHLATDLVSEAIVANVCENLVRFGAPSGHAQAALATAWATLDNRTWTFTLREGVQFHDGAALDADAVVANVEEIRKERGFPGRAERVGPLVVAIVLEKPSAALLATLSQPVFSLQSPRSLGPTASPVGTGPFRLSASRPGLVQLEANEHYWGGAPRLRHLVFRRLASEDALAEALRSGDVDLSSALGQDRIARLKGDPGLTLDTTTGLNVAFLSVNNERPFLSDRRVRHALARAVDRPALVDGILGGHGETARNPLPPSLWGYGAQTKVLALDRRAARALLAEAGLPGGFDTTLLVVDSPRPYMPAPLRLAARLAEDLDKVGVRARLRTVASWPEYIDHATRGDYDLAVLGWQADTTDPNDFLTALLGSESIGTTNRSRYRSEVMDALLKQGRMAADSQGRLKAYREAQELFQKEMPWVPLYHVSTFTAHRTLLRGVAIGPTGIVRYDKVWKAE
jgi:peptide/nickel transport system substrate-binding protein